MKVSGVFLAALLLATQGSPIPDEAAEQADVARKISPREKAVKATSMNADTQDSKAEAPNSNDAAPVAADSEAAIQGIITDGNQETPPQALDEQFVKEVLQGFFSDLKNRPDLVEKIMKHMMAEKKLQNSDPVSMTNGRTIHPAELMMDSNANNPGWQDTPVSLPAQQQQQLQQRQTPEISPPVESSSTRNVNPTPEKEQINTQRQQQHQMQPQQTQQLQLQQPQNPQQQFQAQVQQMQQQQQLLQQQQQQQQQQPGSPNIPTMVNPAVNAAYKSGPNSYYVYPLLPDQTQSGTMDGIVPAVQQNGGVPGSLNPGMDLYYDVGVPDYYYYFYYDDQDGSDIVSPIDVVSGGAGGVRPLNVIGGGNKNPINTSGKVTGIGNPSGDSSSQEVPPSAVEMKGNNFAGESSRALSPSPDDIKVEDDLTKLHN